MAWAMLATCGADSVNHHSSTKPPGQTGSMTGFYHDRIQYPLPPAPASRRPKPPPGTPTFPAPTSSPATTHARAGTLRSSPMTPPHLRHCFEVPSPTSSGISSRRPRPLRSRWLNVPLLPARLRRRRGVGVERQRDDAQNSAKVSEHGLSRFASLRAWYAVHRGRRR
jgi:hypothetical protein